MIDFEKLLRMRFGITKFFILKLLHQKPMNIKEITKELSKKKIISKTSYSNIHRSLKELEQNKFIYCRQKKDRRGKPKVYYLTNKGRRLSII